MVQGENPALATLKVFPCSNKWTEKLASVWFLLQECTTLFRVEDVVTVVNGLGPGDNTNPL